MRKLAEAGTVLEICPSSNLRTHAVASLAELGAALRTFEHAGVRYTINTDGPYLLNTHLRQEYELLIDAKILSDAEAERTVAVARAATFIRSLWEISVEVNNAFSIENRRAIAVAEERLRRVPGVRRVFGPARLADLSVDAGGKVSVRPVLNRGLGESEDEAARQRVVRRADALGWFLSPDGSRVRFLIDADDLGPLHAPLGQAIASSGLQLLHADGAHLDGGRCGRIPTTRRAAGWRPAVAPAGSCWSWSWGRTQRSFGRVPGNRRIVVSLAGWPAPPRCSRWRRSHRCAGCAARGDGRRGGGRVALLQEQASDRASRRSPRVVAPVSPPF